MLFGVRKLELPFNIGGASLVNGGPDILYYRSRSGVSATVNDGSLTVGQAAALDGTQWLVSAGSSQVQVVDTSPPITRSASTPLATYAINVATTSTTVSPDNPDRTLLTLTNTSDTGIWYRKASSGAAVGVGDFLAPNGGSNGGENYSGPVCAVHIGASGTKVLAVIET